MWPVVAVFEDWPFPITLPGCWLRTVATSKADIDPPERMSQSKFSQVVKSRDISCRLSGHRTGTEVAHLCPETETDWFIENNIRDSKKCITRVPNISSRILPIPYYYGQTYKKPLMKGPSSSFLLFSFFKLKRLALISWQGV